MLYASYLNDGLVILDIGNGIKGGSPSNPQLVSQYKYDLDSLCKPAEAGGAPVIGGTHTAWRTRTTSSSPTNCSVRRDEHARLETRRSARRAGCTCSTCSDIFHPKPVAWYEPEYGGVHNVWVVGDTLYMGAYNAGFRAFDISGELRGDLRAQQREMAHVNPVDPKGHHPERGDDVGRGGEERARVRARHQQRAVHHADRAEGGESFRDRRCAVARRSLGCARSLGAQPPPTRDYLVSSRPSRSTASRSFASGRRAPRSSRSATSAGRRRRSRVRTASPCRRTRSTTSCRRRTARRSDYLQKYNAETDSVEGNVMLGNFPATVQVSPDGYYVYVVNFNLHGDMVPSTCPSSAPTRWWRSRASRRARCRTGRASPPTARKHYSACMMDEMLVEIDTRTLSVSRHFSLTAGKEMGMTGAPQRVGARLRTTWAHGMEPPKPATCRARRRGRNRRPTDRACGWRATSRARSSRSTRDAWKLVRRIPAGPGVYNLGAHARRHAADRHEQARSIGVGDRRRDAARSWRAFRRRARSCTASPCPTTIATRSSPSRDGCAAGDGGRRSISSRSTKVASVDVGQQAGGIDFFRSEASRP